MNSMPDDDLNFLRWGEEDILLSLDRELRLVLACESEEIALDLRSGYGRGGFPSVDCCEPCDGRMFSSLA
jgi:hypothetical protein